MVRAWGADRVLPPGPSIHCSQSPLDSRAAAVTRLICIPGLCPAFPRIPVPGEQVLSLSARVPLPLLRDDLSCTKRRCWCAVRFEPKSVQAPSDMTPEANAAVANRARLKAWGTAALLICGVGRQGTSHHPKKCFGCEASTFHRGKQEWSTRFSSAAGGRRRGFGEPASSGFILYSGLVSHRKQGDTHSLVRSSSQPQPASSRRCSASSPVVHSTACAATRGC